MKKMQQSYQGEVILRMFSGDKKKMAEFHEDYKDARFTQGGDGDIKIGDKERKMLEMYNEGKSIAHIAKASNMSDSQVRTRLFYAAVKK